jgi:hypothetical protein
LRLELLLLLWLWKLLLLQELLLFRLKLLFGLELLLRLDKLLLVWLKLLLLLLLEGPGAGPSVLGQHLRVTVKAAVDVGRPVAHVGQHVVPEIALRLGG